MKKNNSGYIYDAFISYRHTEPDMFVAVTLHKMLESFRLKDKQAKAVGKDRINRVFRDQEELPLAANLADPITEALGESEYLIVICTPRLRESRWCMKEIDTFIEMNGREKVFAVLAEGEPCDSFPEQLLYREEEAIGADGTVSLQKVPMEPLAADVRGADHRAIKKAMKVEILRLLAPMFGLSFDDLRQRHKEQRQKKILRISLAIASACAVFGAVSTTMALRISSQNRQIEAQNAEILEQKDALLHDQALSLSRESQKKLEEGDRMGALEDAIAACTSYEGMELPYTPQAQLALTNATYAYNQGFQYVPDFQMKTEGYINAYRVSDDKKTLAVSDDANTLYIFDAVTGREYTRIKGVTGFDNAFSFLDNDRLLYITESNEAAIYAISTGQSTPVECDEALCEVYHFEGGSLAALVSSNVVILMDINTEELVTGFYVESGAINKIWDIAEDKKLVIFSVAEADSMEFFDYETGVQQSMYLRSYEFVTDVKTCGGDIYLVTYVSNPYDFVYTTRIYSINENFELNWQTTEDNATGDRIFFSDSDKSQFLLTCSDGRASLYDVASGEENASFSPGSKVVNVYEDVAAGTFELFTQDGSFYAIDPVTSVFGQQNGVFTACSSNLKWAGQVSNGFISIPNLRDTITHYSRCEGKDAQPFDGELSYPDLEAVYDEAAVELASEYFEYPGLCDHVFYDDDSKVGFYVFKNLKLYVVDEKSGTVVSDFDIENTTVCDYIGQDSHGYHFLSGYSDGYILDENYELIGVAEHLRNLYPDEGTVVLGGDGKNLKLNVLSREELVEYGQALLGER